MDHIFVATDFSPSARKATHYAAALARRYAGRLTLLNVVDLSIVAASAGTLIGPAVDVLKEEQQRRLDEAAEELHGVKVDVLLLEEFSPATAIVSAVEHASVLVMGTTAKHGAAKAILGSVAEQVLRSAPCPVLTVGPNAPEPEGDSASFREIVFATDFSAQAAKAAPVALAFAEDNRADLYVCHATEKGKAQLEGEQSGFLTAMERSVPASAYDWCSPHCVVEHGKAPEAILDLAKDVHADLLVLGARKASFWLEYLHQGLTPALLAEARCPVLTIC